MAQIHAKLLQTVLDQNLIEKYFFVCHAVKEANIGIPAELERQEIDDKISELLEGDSTLGYWLTRHHKQFHHTVYKKYPENKILLRRKWVEWMIQNHSIFEEKRKIVKLRNVCKNKNLHGVFRLHSDTVWDGATVKISSKDGAHLLRQCPAGFPSETYLVNKHFAWPVCSYSNLRLIRVSSEDY